MIGMVYKDYLVMRKQMSYYLVFFVVYAGLVVAGVFPASILPALVVVMGMMLPMSSFAYDDQARWDKYAAASPAGRRGLVGSKYLFTILTLAASGIVVILLMLALALPGLIQITFIEALATTLACMGVGLLINAVILPIMVKFGAEKSRIISILLFAVVFGGAMLIGTLADKGVSIPMPPAWLLNALPVMLGLVAVGAYVISYFIAQGIIAKKEL